MKRKETIKEYLKCVLTEPEIKEAGAKLARRYSEINEFEEQKKSYDSEIKAKINQATAEASGLARTIQNGYEYRNVDCCLVFDYDEKVVEVNRMDTGEVIKTRVMTADELQKGLFEKKDEQGEIEQEEPTAEEGEQTEEQQQEDKGPFDEDEAALKKLTA